MEIHRKMKTLRIRCYQHLYHPRRPRGGQLGQEKRGRLRTFSRAGERAPAVMLLLRDQFHNSSECLSVIVDKRPAFIALLS